MTKLAFDTTTYPLKGAGIIYQFGDLPDAYTVLLKWTTVLVTNESLPEDHPERYQEFVVWGEFEKRFPYFAAEVRAEAVRRMEATITAVTKTVFNDRVREVTDNMYQ